MREDAAQELGDAGPPLAAVPELLAALSREQYSEPYIALLVALGRSGIREVKPILDRQLASREEPLRDAAREAMAHWLVRNRVLAPNEPLPDPNRIVERTPLHPDVPGAYSLEELTGVAAPEPASFAGPTRVRSTSTRDAGKIVLPLGGAMVFAGVLGILISATYELEGPDEILGWTVPLALGGSGVMVAGGVMLHSGSQWRPLGSGAAQTAGASVPKVRGAGLSWRF